MNSAYLMLLFITESGNRDWNSCNKLMSMLQKKVGFLDLKISTCSGHEDDNIYLQKFFNQIIIFSNNLEVRPFCRKELAFHDCL